MNLGRSQTYAARAARLDQRTFQALSRWRSPVLDMLVPGITRAADHGVLWVAVSAGMAALPSRRARSAAERGLASLALSSAIVNQLGKRLVPRQRPDLVSVPRKRRAVRVPTSSSFPSGHAASAAAFAVAVAIEDPQLAVPIGLLAVAVGFSRVYTGVHYPSDVLAGAAVGASVAGLGALIAPPARRHRSAEPRGRINLGRRSTGAGVGIVVNPRAGKGAARHLPAQLARDLPDAHIVVLRTGDDLVDVLRQTAAGAEVLGVAGGDGSVGAAAAVAIEHRLPLLVIPAGTLNHFARDLSLDGPRDAVAAVRVGNARQVDTGWVDGKLFLNTASLGSYPAFVAVRQKWQDRIGKPLASLVASDRVLRGEPPLEMPVSGHGRTLPALFVGAGRYEPPRGVPLRRDRLDSGVLDIRYLEVYGRPARLDALARLLARGDALPSPFAHTEEKRLTLHVHSATLLARDGEITPLQGGDVTFTIDPAALTVFGP